ncbi:hypothetical protein CANCADRAFT_13829, partial [Tortispora caseinolytica NRRL Y-17796]
SQMDEAEAESSPFLNNIKEKTRQNPFVPIGMIATTWAMWGAYRAIRRGNAHRAQRMFRYRVGAQLVTVALVGAGALYYETNYQHLNQSVEEKQRLKSEERKKMWLEDLDRENREIEERRKR